MHVTNKKSTFCQKVTVQKTENQLKVCWSIIFLPNSIIKLSLKLHSIAI